MAPEMKIVIGFTSFYSSSRLTKFLLILSIFTSLISLLCLQFISPGGAATSTKLANMSREVLHVTYLYAHHFRISAILKRTANKFCISNSKNVKYWLGQIKKHKIYSRNSKNVIY